MRRRGEYRQERDTVVGIQNAGVSHGGRRWKAQVQPRRAGCCRINAAARTVQKCAVYNANPGQEGICCTVGQHVI